MYRIPPCFRTRIFSFIRALFPSQHVPICLTSFFCLNLAWHTFSHASCLSLVLRGFPWRFQSEYISWVRLLRLLRTSPRRFQQPVCGAQILSHNHTLFVPTSRISSQLRNTPVRLLFIASITVHRDRQPIAHLQAAQVAVAAVARARGRPRTRVHDSFPPVWSRSMLAVY